MFTVRPATITDLNRLVGFSLKLAEETDPELTTREGFSKLTQTVDEVKNIHSLLEGKVITGLEASEKNFRQNASKYGILHLAMHAFTDEDNPMVSGLIFSDNADDDDDVLRAYELQGMRLNAQLAVLSACNTGSGKLEKGEGVMNLGRGFRQAGVPNIVMSLWQVDDAATQELMTNFYSIWLKGTEKHAAFRQAQLELRAKYPQPFYWGAFVLSGH